MTFSGFVCSCTCTWCLVPKYLRSLVNSQTRVTATVELKFNLSKHSSLLTLLAAPMAQQIVFTDFRLHAIAFRERSLNRGLRMWPFGFFCDCKWSRNRRPDWPCLCYTPVVWWEHVALLPAGWPLMSFCCLTFYHTQDLWRPATGLGCFTHAVQRLAHEFINFFTLGTKANKLSVALGPRLIKTYCCSRHVGMCQLQTHILGPIPSWLMYFLLLPLPHAGATVILLFQCHLSLLSHVSWTMAPDPKRIVGKSHVGAPHE